MDTIKKTKAQLYDNFYKLAMEVIEGENYNIVDGVSHLPSDFANAAANIFRDLLRPNEDKTAYELTDEPIGIFTLGLQWMVRNHAPGIVSCSNEERTGVSHSNASIINRVYALNTDAVKELLDMMNEAWYLMTENNDLK